MKRRRRRDNTQQKALLIYKILPSHMYTPAHTTHMRTHTRTHMQLTYVLAWTSPMQLSPELTFLPTGQANPNLQNAQAKPNLPNAQPKPNPSKRRDQNLPKAETCVVTFTICWVPHMVMVQLVFRWRANPLKWPNPL